MSPCQILRAIGLKAHPIRTLKISDLMSKNSYIQHMLYPTSENYGCDFITAYFMKTVRGGDPSAGVHVEKHYDVTFRLKVG